MSRMPVVLAVVVLSGIAPAGLAAPLSYIATLNGPSEEPPNASPGTGTALVTIDPVAHTMRVVVDFVDLLSGNTMAHIHVMNGPGDANTADTIGPVATTTPTFPGFPTGATSGAYDQTFDTTLDASYRAGWITDSGGTAALAETELFAGIDEGRAYFNIHTSTFPGGEIRGFFVLVPEPSSVAMAAAALAGLLAASARRRH